MPCTGPFGRVPGNAGAREASTLVRECEVCAKAVRHPAASHFGFGAPLAPAIVLDLDHSLFRRVHRELRHRLARRRG